jgi:Na+/H+ antiporter NhaD/arsenite permease-like protein
MSLMSAATLLIVICTIGGIAVGRWPFLRANRTVITLLGAALLLGIGALTLTQAYATLDLDTLLLLFSMMVLNGHLFLAGFFKLVTQQVVRAARSPRMLLALVIVASGVLSALFLNDTVVLMMTPLVLETTRALRRNPIPYLLGVATAANVGSVAAITGNPQNIVIGSASGISYGAFTAALAPTAMIGLAICWLVIVLSYRSEFRADRFVVPEGQPVRIYKPLMRKIAVVIPAMLALFLAGQPVALATFLAAAALLATRRIKPDRVFATIDWSLLVFFAGLFVVTGSLEAQGLTSQLFVLLHPIAQAGLIPFGLVTAVLSNLISNVPAVLLLQHLVPAFANPTRAWLMLSAASTLAGNLTLLGSVANLIVAELAARWNVRLAFRAHLRVGVPVTLLTLLVALLLV